VDLEQILFNGAAVDPYPDRNFMNLGRSHDPGQFIRSAEIAGIDADGLSTIFHGSHGQTVIEMDIGNKRDGDRRPNPGESRGRIKIKNGHPDQFTARLFEGVNLGDGGVNITGVGIGHRLHRNGTVAAHHQIADPYLPGLPPHNHVPVPCR